LRSQNTAVDGCLKRKDPLGIQSPGNPGNYPLNRLMMRKSPSRDLNTGPADYKSAALPTKPLRRHMILSVDSKKGGAPISFLNKTV
jgi:hypothetical protein